MCLFLKSDFNSNKKYSKQVKVTFITIFIVFYCFTIEKYFYDRNANNHNSGSNPTSLRCEHYIPKIYVFREEGSPSKDKGNECIKAE